MQMYYDCPFEALYMIKNFGVKLRCRYRDEDIEDGVEFYDFTRAECGNTFKDLLDFKFGKIYVCPESYEVFGCHDSPIKKLPPHTFIMDGKAFLMPKFEEELTS